MKHLLVTCLAVVGLGVLGSNAEAGRRNRCCDDCCNYGCGYSCGTPIIQYQEQVVTCYKAEWRTEKVPMTVTRCVLKEVVEPVEYTVCKMEVRTENVPTTVTRCVIKEVAETVNYTVLVPKMVTVKQKQTYCVAVPKTVERDVVTCRYVPVACVDPCTGCSYTSCRPETVVQKVSCTVYETQLATRDVDVQVCQYEKQTRTATVKRCVPEYIQDKVTVTRSYCVAVPQTVKTTVKRCVPEYIKENVTVERRYCVSVPHQVTVRVPVCVGYSSDCCGVAAAPAAPTAPATMPKAEDD